MMGLKKCILLTAKEFIHVVASSRRRVVASSRRHVDTSSRRHVVTSSHCQAKLTMNVNHDSLRHWRRDSIGRDAEIGAHVGPGQTFESQFRSFNRFN